MEAEVHRAVRHWFAPDEILHIEAIPGGRVNHTFLVAATKGDFILQKLHPVFGTDGALVRNTALAASCLKKAGLPAPEVIPTRNGHLWLEDNGIWRMSLRLPGRAAHERTPSAASEAARGLGRFHRALTKEKVRLEKLPRAEHGWEGPFPLERWTGLVEQKNTDPKFPKAAPVLKRGSELARTLPQIPAGPRTIVHGDPKLENFLFDDSGRFSGLIDLDTVREGDLIWELADALRSWSGIRDRRDRMTLDIDVYRAAVSGYRQEGLELTDTQWSRLPEACAAVCLNLALRYLTDYFEEAYFAWDRARYPSLAEQNLSRGRGYLELAEHFLDQGKDL